MSYDELQHALGALGRGDWERLGRYLAGRSTPAESEAVERWIAADPRREELVRELRRARVASETAPEIWGARTAWQRLVATLEADGSWTTAGDVEAPASPVKVLPFPQRQTTPAPQPQRRRSGLAATLRIAASVAALVGGTMLWQNRTELFAPKEIALRELSAGVGERKRITLADGSEIVLGSSSRIWFPERFGRTREIRLEGEAVFDVATDSARAFLVRTDASVTRVLGTRFGVRAYPEDRYVEVVVEEGRVAVAAAVAHDSASVAGGRDDVAYGKAARSRSMTINEEPSGTLLTPGLALRVEEDGTLSAPRQVDAARALSWTEGRLVFDDMPLHEVVRTLERRYGIKLKLADQAVAELRLTAEFEQLTKDDVVEFIALSLGIEYRKTPNGFLLTRSTTPVGGARR